jgi:hypothetical protein
VDAVENLRVALNVGLCFVDLFLESNSLLAVSIFLRLKENTANLKISKMWMRQKIYRLAIYGE